MFPIPRSVIPPENNEISLLGIIQVYRNRGSGKLGSVEQQVGA